ncbi:MAG: hypothetical protein ACRD2O_13210 [Terriglobia bacterium]
MQKKLSLIAIIVVLGLMLAACKQGNQQTASQEAQQAASPATSQAAAPAAAPTATPPASPAPAPARRRAEAAAPPAQPPKPRVETYTIPTGATVSIHLDSAISSASATSGSSFSGTLATPIAVGGRTVIPAGSAVSGHVTSAVSSGRLNRPAELALTLDSLTPRGGNAVQIATNTLSSKGSSHKKRDGVLIGGGAGLGALIGAIAGKGKGAAIGGLIGAGAGTAGAAATGKKEINLPAETSLKFELASPVTVTRRAGSSSGDATE